MSNMAEANSDIECASNSDKTVDKKHANAREDDYGRLYGRSRNSKKYQLASKRLSRRKGAILRR